MANVSGDGYSINYDDVINDLPVTERELVARMSDADREITLKLHFFGKQEEMGMIGVTASTRQKFPSAAELNRMKQLSDEALYEELLSAVKVMGDERLENSAVNIVNILKRKTERIMALEATLRSQEKELKRRETVRVALGNLELGSASSPHC